MGKDILDAVTKVGTDAPGKRAMYVVIAYIVIVITGAGLFSLWPDTAKYAWMDLSSPTFLWIGVGSVVLSFVLIVLYMIYKAPLKK